MTPFTNYATSSTKKSLKNPQDNKPAKWSNVIGEDFFDSKLKD